MIPHLRRLLASKANNTDLVPEEIYTAEMNECLS
jgi:hypothetical protein